MFGTRGPVSAEREVQGPSVEPVGQLSEILDYPRQEPKRISPAAVLDEHQVDDPIILAADADIVPRRRAYSVRPVEGPNKSLDSSAHVNHPPEPTAPRSRCVSTTAVADGLGTMVVVLTIQRVGGVSDMRMGGG